MQSSSRKSGSDFHEMLGIDRQATTGTPSSELNGSVESDTRSTSSSVHRKAFQEKKRLQRHKLSRELKSLRFESSADAETTVLLPSHIKRDSGRKFNFGSGTVRPWVMAPIHNPARKDNLVLEHWVRKEDANTEYIFARLNTVTPVPRYSADEYDKYLASNGWTKESTDNLMDLAQRYDLRWIIVEDRWPDDELGAKSLDDLRERYYDVHNRLQKARTEKSRQPNLVFFDNDNERRRREQLNNLWMRTVEQAKEEQELIEGLNVIEAHKLERQKKVQDLEKLISHEKRPRKTPDAIAQLSSRKRPSDQRLGVSTRRDDFEKIESASTKLRMADQTKSGVSLRSQRTRLLPLLGSNKVKAIELALDYLQLEHMPIALNEQVSEQFTELRADILRLYEYKSILRACEYEFEAVKCQRELEASSALIVAFCNLSPSVFKNDPLVDAPTFSTSSDPQYRVATAMTVPSTQETVNAEERALRHVNPPPVEDENWIQF
ncbi:hypothetical protein M513_04765 [Trichuris suis]|uniref:DNA methyltransferase 1-associated protein 1 n=1 Tax=Trichuris suis TaxID=68888 RepID=A0A085MB26_9BILA|nr:hypothetical protein M513_04765 [Trichuris suis]